MPILAAICASDSPSRAQPSIRVRPSGSNHCSYLPGLAIVNHSYSVSAHFLPKYTNGVSSRPVIASTTQVVNATATQSFALMMP